MAGFEDEGVRWEGSRRELSAWKAYKRAKAKRFVELNYSVAWYPDGTNWMDIYIPERHHAKQPELRAEVKFFSEPSKYGINGGRISKLTIQTRTEDLLSKAVGRPYEKIETLFNYDRGPDIDRLDENPKARKLYEHVLAELG
jgi:hypothetical protein